MRELLSALKDLIPIPSAGVIWMCGVQPAVTADPLFSRALPFYDSSLFSSVPFLCTMIPFIDTSEADRERGKRHTDLFISNTNKNPTLNIVSFIIKTIL